MAPMRPNETSLGEARSQARNNGRVPNKFSVSVASPHATSETYQIYFKNLNYNFFHGGKKKDDAVCYFLPREHGTASLPTLKCNIG